MVENKERLEALVLQIRGFSGMLGKIDQGSKSKERVKKRWKRREVCVEGRGGGWRKSRLLIGLLRLEFVSLENGGLELGV